MKLTEFADLHGLHICVRRVPKTHEKGSNFGPFGGMFFASIDGFCVFENGQIKNTAGGYTYEEALIGLVCDIGGFKLVSKQPPHTTISVPNDLTI